MLFIDLLKKFYGESAVQSWEIPNASEINKNIKLLDFALNGKFTKMFFFI